MKKTYLFLQIVLLILVISFITSCNGQSNSNNNTTSTDRIKVEKINELVSLYSEYDGFNGSVLVAHKGKIIYKKGFGLANMEWEIPNQVDTKFRIASVTKPFTAMLIMQLVAENKLDLHEPISTYLSDYPKENGDQITIHHLLTHTSGIARDYDFDLPKNNYPDRQRSKESVQSFSNRPLEFKPGKRFSYSNSGYAVLGYIIETVTGKSYETVLQENILSPLGMKNTGIDKHRPIMKNKASGYFKGFGEYFNADYKDMSTISAVGNIYSTVEDMFLFDQALYAEKLLPKKYIDLVFTKYIPADFGGHYGYGWELAEKPMGNTTDMIATIGHSGSLSGYCSVYTRIPSSQSTIIFLNNTKRAFLNAMTKAITGILYDKTYDFPLKPLAKFMSETIEKEGIEKGILFYKEHKDLDDYHVSEQELIVAGYKILHAGNAKDAAEVFKLSTEIFPYRDNPYDSYAEALMTLGKEAEAIKNYKKSLLLNPRNQNAEKMLQKLTGKKPENISLLKTEDTWGKEVFLFPLNFARGLNYKGFEEAQFPKGWREEESPEFWSYAFVWNIGLDENLTETELEKNLQIYFDGLMKSVNKEKGKILPNAVADIDKIKNSNDVLKFTGTIKTYDSFATKKPLLLNVQIEKQDCKQTKRSFILFKFSPKNFNHAIWKTLEKIELRDNVCEN